MHKLNAIRSSVMNSEMKDDSLVPASRPFSDQLTPEMVPAHVLKAVYSKRIRRNGMGICDLFCCDCCQKRRKASSYVPMSGVADDELPVFGGDPSVPLVNSPRTVEVIEPDNPLIGMDDCISALTAETYYYCRTKKLI